jgi:hypothetical protein
MKSTSHWLSVMDSLTNQQLTQMQKSRDERQRTWFGCCSTDSQWTCLRFPGTYPQITSLALDAFGGSRTRISLLAIGATVYPSRLATLESRLPGRSLQLMNRMYGKATQPNECGNATINRLQPQHSDMTYLF